MQEITGVKVKIKEAPWQPRVPTSLLLYASAIRRVFRWDFRCNYNKVISETMDRCERKRQQRESGLRKRMEAA